MSEHVLLADSVERVLRDALDGQLPVPPLEHWDRPAWDELVGMGMAGVGIPESTGGSGGDILDVLTIVRSAARVGAAVPLADHGAIAGWLLSTVGRSLPEEVTTWVVCTGDPGASVSMANVAWGAVAEHVVIVRATDDGTGEPITVDVVAVGSGERRRVDVSGEHGADLVLLRSGTGGTNASVSAAEVRQRVALVRCAQMTGALEALLPQCATYVREREQFGRPIASFQAVQHLLARLAGEVLAAQASLDVASAARGDAAPLAIAAAKIRIGEAATKASRIAHQLHGAIGFTEEHRLARFTRRLLRWREDGGNETEWARRLGEQLAVIGSDGVWPLLTSVPALGRDVEATP